MKTSMTFKDYLGILRAYSNIPLTMNRLTLPFGIISDSVESDTLLVGHVLDDLAARLSGKDPVDPIDVAAIAYDLGHEQAGPFLDQAPDILYRIAKETGIGHIH